MKFATPKVPKTYYFSVAAGNSFTVTFPGTATYCQILNDSGAGLVTVQLNGDSSAAFDLAHDAAIVFGDGDLHLTSLVFTVANSGGTTQSVLVIAGIVP